MSSIGRKHFGAIASAVENADYLNDAQRALIANDLADAIKAVASNLDRTRFLEACNVEVEAFA